MPVNLNKYLNENYIFTEFIKGSIFSVLECFYLQFLKFSLQTKVKDMLCITISSFVLNKSLEQLLNTTIGILVYLGYSLLTSR